jgi:predicted nucleotidyltransferase
MTLIDANREKLYSLCEKHKVDELYLFGSILTDRFIDSSDVDILVQFGKVELEQYADNYFDFKEELERLFNRSVDLVENQSIKNQVFRKVVDREKQLVYERKDS